MHATLPYHSPGLLRRGTDTKQDDSFGHDVASGSSAMVIDWSDLRSCGGRTSVNISELIDWVSNCPRPYNLRVYLPSGPRDRMFRLQRKLLSLGCTVTCRFPSC